MNTMRYMLLNILACPMCKYFPLKLYAFNEQRLTIPQNNVMKPLCNVFCGLNGKHVHELNDMPPECNECISRDVVWGILLCDRCGRWYPIVNGVPLMYPDDIRLNTRIRFIEKFFIKKFIDNIPSDVLSRDPLKIVYRYGPNVHESK